MSRFVFALASAAALALALSAAPRALALARVDQQTDGSPAAATAPQTAMKLNAIVVHGHKLYWPVVLQMIKNGLSRPYSTHRKDLDKLVCQFEPGRERIGVTLYCETNRHHWQFVRALLSGRDSAAAGGGGSLPVRANMVILHRNINRAALLKLLNKLPPAGSSYTLRVMDHGMASAEYVFKHGQLVKILR